MSKTDRQAEQLKHVSGGGQTPGTNWGSTPGEATQGSAQKERVPNTPSDKEEAGNEQAKQDDK
jgi:hypothetical protein